MNTLSGNLQKIFRRELLLHKLGLSVQVSLESIFNLLIHVDVNVFVQLAIGVVLSYLGKKENREEGENALYCIVLPVKNDARHTAHYADSTVDTEHGVPQANQKSLHGAWSLGKNEFKSRQEHQNVSKTV